MKLNIRKIGITISVVVIIIIIFLVAKRDNNQTVSIPTSVPVVFEFTSVNPPNGSTSNVPSTTAVDFNFSKPIDYSTIAVISTPNINISFNTDQTGKILFVRSIDGWQTGTKYNFKINLKSKDGEALPELIDYSFQIQKPTQSLMDERPTGK